MKLGEGVEKLLARLHACLKVGSATIKRDVLHLVAHCQ
jgi:hypothetical protein